MFYQQNCAIYKKNLLFINIKLNYLRHVYICMSFFIYFFKDGLPFQIVCCIYGSCDFEPCSWQGVLNTTLTLMP